MTRELELLLEGRHLGEDGARALLLELAQEDASPALAGAILAALRAKGETADEVRGFTRAMRTLALRPALPAGRGPLVDTCGTGGDGSGSLNLSTGTGLVAAARGARVVKHGNRSVSSRAGSADVLEALGVALPLADGSAARFLDTTGFTFLFAPHFHPAMKTLAPVRRALGVRTIFNLLGPLTNPAEPPYQLLGVFSAHAAALVAETLAGLPIERAFVVHGAQGWDEATPLGPFLLFDVRAGHVERTHRDPSDYGLARCTPADLSGGTAAYNATRLEAALAGEPGAHGDALVLGAALVLELTGLAAGPREAAAIARAALAEGRAAAVLAGLREVSRAA